MAMQYLSIENVCKKLPTVVDPSYIQMLCDQGKIAELLDEIGRLNEKNETLRNELSSIQDNCRKQSAEYETVVAKYNQAKLLLDKMEDSAEDARFWKKGYSEGFVDGFMKGKEGK